MTTQDSMTKCRWCGHWGPESQVDNTHAPADACGHDVIEVIDRTVDPGARSRPAGDSTQAGGATLPGAQQDAVEQSLRAPSATPDLQKIGERWHDFQQLLLDALPDGGAFYEMTASVARRGDDLQFDNLVVGAKPTQQEVIEGLRAKIQFLIDSWPTPMSDGGITFPDGDFWPRSCSHANWRPVAGLFGDDKKCMDCGVIIEAR